MQHLGHQQTDIRVYTCMVEADWSKREEGLRKCLWSDYATETSKRTVTDEHAYSASGEWHPSGRPDWRSIQFEGKFTLAVSKQAPLRQSVGDRNINWNRSI